METLLTRLTASLTELREPGKVLAKAGNESVAILNRNGAVSEITTSPLGKEDLRKYLKTGLPQIEHVIDYLKDK
jgi:hypothetical protein